MTDDEAHRRALAGQGIVDAEVVLFLPPDAKIDTIMPDGTHRYWSTHCRHAGLLDGYEARRLHEMCSATEMSGRNVQDREGWSATIARQPAQCKHCAAPCLCECHSNPPDEES